VAADCILLVDNARVRLRFPGPTIEYLQADGSWSPVLPVCPPVALLSLEIPSA